MSYERFIDAVSWRCGFEERAPAERAVEATLRVLAERLDEADARAVARQLPPRLASLMRADEHGAEFGLADLYDRVARLEGVNRSFAAEHAQVVCQVLCDYLDDEGRKHLRVHVPPEIADLFTPRPPAAPLRAEDRPRHRAPPGSGRTLASGRPGSSRPLSEADGWAHTDSVVRSADPYADRKISSARGTTQEVEGETLATGKPGSKHPVSESE